MCNEDLLRKGECSYPNCIEPTGHSGPCSFAPMTDEEMLLALGKIWAGIEAITCPSSALQDRDEVCITLKRVIKVLAARRRANQLAIGLEQIEDMLEIPGMP